MGPGHRTETLQRFIVENATVLYNSAMAMICVFVDADVGHDHQPRDLVLHRFDGPLHDAVRIKPRTSPRIFPVRNPKEDDGGIPKAAISLASFTKRSTESLNWPGIEVISSRRSRPSTTNSG